LLDNIGNLSAKIAFNQKKPSFSCYPELRLVKKSLAFRGEKTMKDKETIVVDIYLTRGLVALLALALLIVAGLGYLAWNRDEVAASGLQASAPGLVHRHASILSDYHRLSRSCSGHVPYLR
jgi:ABC-type Fe3+-siderophore transport system permease subunit